MQIIVYFITAVMTALLLWYLKILMKGDRN